MWWENQSSSQVTEKHIQELLSEVEVKLTTNLTETIKYTTNS